MRRLIAGKTKNTKTQKDTATKRSKSRTSKRAPMPTSSWRKRLMLGGIGAIISAGVGLSAFAMLSDQPRQYWETVQADALQWTVRNGYYVADVQAVGRNNTSTHDILTALNVGHATPILTLDLKTSQQRIESLPWVKTAQVERHLPNVLRVVIEERIPVAISQAGKKSVLIDASGTAIVPVRNETNDLPIVTGKGAPQHVAALLQDLNTVPELITRVRAAVRVGNRRWNLRLDNVVGGVEVRLPETNAAAAWQQLAVLQQSHKLLRRDVAMIDLRLPDRLVVRLANGQTLPPSKLDQYKNHKSKKQHKRGVSA